MDNFQQWRAAMLDKVGAYWDAAFREGRNGSGCEADAANSILHGDGGIEALMQAHQAALAELQLYRALCEGYTLEELQRMSLTFKAQIDVLRARSEVVKTAPVAWRVHPFDYGVGCEGVFALTMREDQVAAWKRKGWRVEPLVLATAQEVGHD